MMEFKFFKTVKEAHEFINQNGYGVMAKRHPDGKPSKNFQYLLNAIRGNGYQISDEYQAVVTWNGYRPDWA